MVYSTQLYITIQEYPGEEFSIEPTITGDWLTISERLVSRTTGPESQIQSTETT